MNFALFNGVPFDAALIILVGGGIGPDPDKGTSYRGGPDPNDGTSVRGGSGPDLNQATSTRNGPDPFRGTSTRTDL